MDKSAPKELEEEGVTDREGAGQEDSSSVRAAASRARIRSSSSMSAMTMGLDRIEHPLLLLVQLPPASERLLHLEDLVVLLPQCAELLRDDVEGWPIGGLGCHGRG